MIQPQIKKGFFWYQRVMWLGGQAYNEANKPLNFFHLTVPYMTYLAVSGYKISTWTFVAVNLIIIVLAVIIGRLLEKYNVISYNQTLANKQSPELLEILEIVKRIENK